MIKLLINIKVSPRLFQLSSLLSFPKFSVGNLNMLKVLLLSPPKFSVGGLNKLRFPTKELGNDKIILSLLLITLTNCITVAKKSEYLEAPVLVKPFPCSSNPGYEADYIDCRFRALTDAYGNRKRFLEEQAEATTEPAGKKQIMLVISETDKKLKDLVTWQNANLAGAKKRDEKWQAEEAKRQAEADRLARIEKIRREKEEKEIQLAEMRRSGKKNPSECRRAKEGLQDCIQNARVGRQGAQVLGALTGVNTGAFQDVASNVETACRTFKATITIACAFVGESEIAEVMSEIKVLETEIREAEKRR